MRQFLGEYLPIILTFCSGGFFWEFARHMFLKDRKYLVGKTVYDPRSYNYVYWSKNDT